MMSFTPFGLLGISVLITLVVGMITTQLYINLCIQDNSWSNSKVILLPFYSTFLIYPLPQI